MHILVTADTLGGVWTYTRELVTGLVRHGERVTLVSFGDIPTAAQTQWMEELPGLDYRPTAFKLEWMLDSEADMIASAEYLEAVIRETRPDVLHLSQFYYGALECNVPRIVVAHSDVVSWWLAVNKKSPPESDWLQWYRQIVARGLHEATFVAAPSQWMLDQMELNYGAPAATTIIHNGRTPALFNPHLGKDENIVSIGRLWDTGKNVSLLLRQEMPMPVRIVGSDRHPEFESPVFSAEEISPNVRLEPEQSEFQIAEILARAGIYAATSRYEPFGLAPVEAAMSRCAIIASDIPTFRELWGEAAVFFHDNDPASLLLAVERLLFDPALQQRAARLAYEHALRHFTAERMVANYLSLYQTLAPARAIA